MLSSNTQHCTGSTIALTIHSFDPLECGDWTYHDSIDIALRLECKRWEIPRETLFQT